jgi:hypothetical protein
MSSSCVCPLLSDATESRSSRSSAKSISEIARLTSLSRNTIKKWLKVPQGTQPRYRRGRVPTKLAPFVEALRQALVADSHRPNPREDPSRRRPGCFASFSWTHRTKATPRGVERSSLPVQRLRFS